MSFSAAQKLRHDITATIFSDYKRDEIVNVYKEHGTTNEKEKVYTILSDLNPSQNKYWDNIKK